MILAKKKKFFKNVKNWEFCAYVFATDTVMPKLYPTVGCKYYIGSKINP